MNGNFHGEHDGYDADAVRYLRREFEEFRARQDRLNELRVQTLERVATTVVEIVEKVMELEKVLLKIEEITKNAPETE